MATDPPHEHRVAFALREALPTRRHGEMLFDMAAEMLGEAGRVEVAADGNHRLLFRREGADPRWIVPWPILTLDRNPRQILPFSIPGVEPVPPPPPRPGKAPNLRGLGPGYVQLQDGLRYVQVAYAADGRWFETSRGGPPSALEGVLPLLAAGGAPPAEIVARFVASLDPAARGPLRAFLPEPGAWGAYLAWFTGMPRLRLAHARGAFPPGARWAALDTVDGSARGWGATREEALAAWSAEVARVRPGSARPPAPAAPSFEPPGEPELPPPPDGDGERPGGTLHIRFEFHGGGDPALPAPEPAPPPAGILPAVVVPLPEPPAAPPPLGAWRLFLDGCGNSVPAALREDPEGWTAVGAAPLAILGAPDAEAALDEAERAWRARNPDGGGSAVARHRWIARTFRLLDEETGLRTAPSTDQALLTDSRDVPVLDGQVFAVGAVRMRRVRA
jgi:hypothetical protein